MHSVLMKRLLRSGPRIKGRDAAAAPAALLAPPAGTSSLAPRAARQPGTSSRRLCAAAAAAGTPSYGLFVCSGCPEVTEAMGAATPDWMCLDAQHGAVPCDRLKTMLCAAPGNSKKIVRVGGPTDRFGIQQALE